MSLEEALQDPDRRRRIAEAYGIASPEQDAQPAPVPPPQAAPAAGPESFETLAKRFLAARQQGEGDARMSRLAAGLDTSARIINEGAGLHMPAATQPQAGLRDAPVADLKEMAQIQALGRKGTTAAKVGKPVKSTEQTSKEIEDLHAFARARWPDEPEAVIAAITPTTLKEIRTTLDAKYGIQSREGLAAGMGERDNAKTKQRDVHFWAKMQQDAEQFGVTDATRRYISEQALAAAQAARDEAAATKEKDKTDAVSVPGYEPVPGEKPQPKDAETLKNINAANGELKRSIANLRALHQRYGTEYGGKGGVNLRQTMTAIKLAAKTIADLGALSGPDQGLMNDLAGGDPSTIEASAKAFFGVDNTDQAMAQLEQWAENRIAAAAEARGYRPRTVAPSPTTRPPVQRGGSTTPAPAPQAVDKVRVIINGEPKTVPRANLEALKQLAKKKTWTLEIPNG